MTRVTLKVVAGRGFPHGVCYLRITFNSTVKKTAESSGPAPTWNSLFSWDITDSSSSMRVEAFSGSRAMGTIVIDCTRLDGFSKLAWHEFRGSPRSHRPEVRLVAHLADDIVNDAADATDIIHGAEPAAQAASEIPTTSFVPSSIPVSSPSLPPAAPIQSSIPTTTEITSSPAVATETATRWFAPPAPPVDSPLPADASLLRMQPEYALA